MGLKNYWYVIAHSTELKSSVLLARQILNEWIVCFRDADGQAVALQDRCLHRNARLSKGAVKQGILTCPYHGWQYAGSGQVIAKPAENPQLKFNNCSKTYQTCERDGYIYVALAQPVATPFAMLHYRAAGWINIRLQNLFNNNVTNCVENFIDIPHTAYVHPKIFRTPRQEKIIATIKSEKDSVHVTYKNEHANLGWFAKFLNPSGKEIIHTDSFYAPNITCVQYDLGPRRKFIITSQSVPLDDETTLVYTDITYNFGIWNYLAKYLVRYLSQKVISQDVKILGEQMRVIKKYGTHFSYTAADEIHRCVELIRKAIEEGSELPATHLTLEFWT